MITELQGRRMTNEQVLDVLKKSCLRHNQKLIHAIYNETTLQLTVLVDSIRAFGGVEADMDSVLIGLCDFNFNRVIDNKLDLKDEQFSPATIVKDNEVSYLKLANAIGGDQLI